MPAIHRASVLTCTALGLGALLSSLSGCAASQPLLVDVHTDLSPGGDFDRIEVRSGSAVVSDPARAIDYVATPARIGPLQVGEGTVDLEVSAMRGTRVVVRRTLRLTVRGPSVVPVWLLRSCVNVECPGASGTADETACEASRCVRPECLGVEASELCPGPECSVDSECEGPVATCARGSCSGGRCLTVEIPGACRSAEYCDPASGCLPLRGALPDAGGAGDAPISTDAGVDAGCWSGDGGACAPGVIGLATGNTHTCFVLADGRAACTGDSNTRSLGVPPIELILWPVWVPALAGVTALGTGDDHVCAVREGGALWCWGDGGRGELGDGATESRTAPSPVLGLPAPVVAMDGGDAHSFALLSDGTVWGFGFNEFGQLGDGTRTSRPLATRVIGVTSARAASAGGSHSCFVDGTGAVFCVGLNDRGQLGDGTVNSSNDVVEVLGLPGPASSVRASARHSCALLEDGTVWCWGHGDEYRLGTGRLGDSSTPVQVSGLTDVIDLDLGQSHGCAVTGSGEVWCWGNNGNGQAGIGVLGSQPVPVPVPLAPAIAIATGTNHSCAILRSGEPYCWGAGARLGDGTGSDRLTPVPVLPPR